MRAALACVGIAAFGLGGCAGVNGTSGGKLGELNGVSPLRVVATRAIDSKVHPMAPVHLAAEGDTIAATFGLPGHRQVVARLDPASLDQLSRDQVGRSEATSTRSAGAVRVVLDGGRFVVCWTRPSVDGGREAVAQMWSASGSRLGAPMVISPPESDVFGSPQAATTDGRHVLVTFPETSGTSFELRAVSLADADQSSGSDRVAVVAR
jgi:hypothetical protein